MRTPKSLSYSSMSLYEKDKEEFFIRYLADKPAPRLPQEAPASVGASFDAHVKSAAGMRLSLGLAQTRSLPSKRSSRARSNRRIGTCSGSRQARLGVLQADWSLR